MSIPVRMVHGRNDTVRIAGHVASQRKVANVHACTVLLYAQVSSLASCWSDGQHANMLSTCMQQISARACY